MDDESLRYWLALSRLKGLTRQSIEWVLRSGGPQAVFERQRPVFALGETPPDALISSAKDFKDWAWVDEEISRAQKYGARLTAFPDDDYPALLREIDDPPVVLYAKGLSTVLNKPVVAVVGTRRPSHYGLSMAGSLGRDLGLMGVTVASGMARGCDTAAHVGALSSAGLTAAVLGTGIDTAYPRENKRLYGEIAEKGLLITEFPFSTPPLPRNFPQRNRIIAGISKGVVVVEAPLRSGALMTARLALGYNRDVLSVPGQAGSGKNAGTNRLIKEGAALVESAADCMEALGIEPALRAQASDTDSAPSGPIGPEERLVFESLSSPMHIDALAKKAGLTISRASSLLLEMELKGLIVQRPGKLFLKRF